MLEQSYVHDLQMKKTVFVAGLEEMRRREVEIGQTDGEQMVMELLDHSQSWTVC